MRIIQQGTKGFLIGLVSVGLVLGGLSLSIMENPNARAAVKPVTPTLTSTQIITATFTTRPLISGTVGISPSPSTTLTKTLPLPSLSPAPPTTCPAPTTWKPYIIQFGDDLASLAATYHTTLEQINRGNCLLTPDLIPGTILFLPPLAAPETITPTLTQQITQDSGCHPPPGWVTYVIQRGDTLIRLSKLFNVTTVELQFANCMGNSTLLVNGVTIFVPFTITLVPTSPVNQLVTSTPSPSPTHKSVPTEASTFLATNTEAPAAVHTLTPTAPGITNTTPTQNPASIPILTMTTTP